MVMTILFTLAELGFSLATSASHSPTKNSVLHPSSKSGKEKEFDALLSTI